MTESKFQPGALVRDNHARVGRVVGGPETRTITGETLVVVPVDFWGEQQLRTLTSLTLVDSDSPEARLLDHPEELASWAEDAPLKLIALALSVDGGSSKMADIREKLSGRVLETGKWDNWWKKTQPQIRNQPEHFKIAKVGKDSEYNLRTYYNSVPGVGKLKSDSVLAGASEQRADWKQWLESPTHDSVPGRYPTRQLVNALPRWPAETIESALLRLITSAEGLGASDNLTAQAAEGWLRAVAVASLRWRETAGPDTAGYTAARVGGALARLSRVAGDRTPQDLLLQAGALDGETDAWRRGFTAGMWEAFDGEDARELYLRSSAALGRQARGDLAREMVLSAFGPDFSERRNSELDRLLDALPEGERVQLLKEVIASATADRRGSVLAYIANSRHGEGVNRGGLRLLASLLLGDGTSEFEDRVSQELANALEPQNHFVNADPVSWSFAESTPTVTVLKSTQRRLDEIIKQMEAEVAEVQASHEAQLDQERQEQERLRQQVRERNAELAANREESRLEIRQDMLLAVGEVLQSACRQDDSGGLAGDVRAGLTLALRAGGAEPLETPGTMVEYNPELHDAKGGAPGSGKVKVVAPGVIYRGGIHGDRVLLKAHVKHEAG